jgi:hypothetical protein
LLLYALNVVSADGMPFPAALVEYVRELADEFGQRLGAVALCDTTTLLVLIEDGRKQRRRAYRGGRRFDVHVWPLSRAQADIAHGSLPIARDAVAIALPIYDPRSILTALRESAAGSAS